MPESVWLWVAVLVSGIFLYLLLFIPPFTPILVADGNSAVFLDEGMRLARGQVIYRDFFEFIFPGTPAIYAVMIEILGLRAWIPNVTLLVLGVAIAWCVTVISRRLLSGVAVMLPALWFLAFAFRNDLDPTEHWFSVLLGLAAATAIIDRRRTRDLVPAGILLGLAVLFSQNNGLGALLGVACFVGWAGAVQWGSWRPAVRAELLLLVPATLVVSICMAYLAVRAGAGNVIRSTLVFPLRYWSSYPANSWWNSDAAQFTSEHLRRIHLSSAIVVIGLVPAIYVLAVLYYRHSKGSLSGAQRSAFILVEACGLFLFASVANSFMDIRRLCPISPPAFVILVWLVARFHSVSAVALAAMFISVGLFMARCALHTQLETGTYLDTRIGRVALRTNNAFGLYEWLEQNTRFGDYVFDTAWPDVYFVLGLRNPTTLAFLTSCDFTRPEQVQGLIKDLDKHAVRFVLWSRDLAPGAEGCPAASDHLWPLRRYLRAHYREVKAFGRESGDVVALERLGAGANGSPTEK